MSQFRKFQFDNFVIGEDILSPKKVEQEVIITQPESTMDNDVVSSETIWEDTTVEEIRYSEDEVNARENLAEEKGYERGFKASQEGLEAQNNRLLEEINNRLLMLVAGIDGKEYELENQVLRIAGEAISKLVPVIEKDNAVALVNEFLNKNFKNFKNESRLAFYFNPDTISNVQQTISRLANIHDFEGKISLHKDSSLSVSDCRVEWDNGGVERNSADMLQKVDKILDVNAHKI